MTTQKLVCDHCGTDWYEGHRKDGSCPTSCGPFDCEPMEADVGEDGRLYDGNGEPVFLSRVAAQV